MISSEPLLTLRSLKLSDNRLESLDVSHIPDLRILYVDRNRLLNVHGTRRTRYLDSFSIREQDRELKSDNTNSDHFMDCFEVRKIYGSGNAISQFLPSTVFLNLQYLELANSGIEHLPQEFGLMMPNIRVLNLNFNAISNIRPLSGIVRLKKLFLAGNRLGRLRENPYYACQALRPESTRFEEQSFDTWLLPTNHRNQDDIARWSRKVRVSSGSVYIAYGGSRKGPFIPISIGSWYETPGPSI